MLFYRTLVSFFLDLLMSFYRSADMRLKNFNKFLYVNKFLSFYRSVRGVFV